MKFMLLIYNDSQMLDAQPAEEFNTDMRNCLAHADELKQEGRLLESQMLKPAPTAKTVRIRNGRQMTHDGPFAEAKEVLGGFNLIEAENMDEAIRMAAEFPWAKTGSVEVRALEDVDAMRKRVGAVESSRV